MPISSPRRRSKSAAAPLDLDEIEQDPGFRGMLSFLEVSPEERLRDLALRKEADRHSPMGDRPMGGWPQGGSPRSEADPLDHPVRSLESAAANPNGPLEIDHAGASASDLPMGQPPMGELPSDPAQVEPGVIPRMDVEGRGKRALRYCRTVQDGHTSSEEIAYQAIWAHAWRYGQTDTNGSQVVDLGLSQLRTILKTDHKNVKRLVTSLSSKLALEVVRPPDYRRALSTRYRIFSYGQILERRRMANLLWVVRTRSVRFVPIEVVSRLLLAE
jgi:hypothetical protein